MFERLQKSKQISVIALDRLGDYIELLRIEMKLQSRELGMQIMGFAVAALFGFFAALFVGIAIIVSFWDSDYRGLAAWFVVALYLAGAGVGVWLAGKHKPDVSAFSTIREELRRDADLVRESL